MIDLTEADLISCNDFNDHASLLPCPFCGTKWEGAISGSHKVTRGLLVYNNAPSSDMHTWAHVVCLTCGAGQNSIRKWNRRTP